MMVVGRFGVSRRVWRTAPKDFIRKKMGRPWRSPDSPQEVASSRMTRKASRKSTSLWGAGRLAGKAVVGDFLSVVEDLVELEPLPRLPGNQSRRKKQSTYHSPHGNWRLSNAILGGIIRTKRSSAGAFSNRQPIAGRRRQ